MLPAIEQRDLMRTRQRRLDQRAAQENGPAENEDFHADLYVEKFTSHIVS